MALRVSDVFEQTVNLHGARLALRGGTKTWTWREYREDVRRAAKAMIARGVEAKRAVSILGYNAPEWVICDIAAILIGARPAGIYTTSSVEQCVYVAGHSDAQLFFASSGSTLERAKEASAQLPAIKGLIPLGGPEWDAFLAEGNDVSDADLQARIDAQNAKDVCMYIYTSGTTGNPKAVMVTHENLTWSAQTIKDYYAFGPGERCVSYLPLSHIAEQILSIHGPMALGSSVTFAKGVDTVLEVLTEVRPTYFLGVPRVWEKIEAKMKAAGASAPPHRQKLVAMAKSIATEAGAKRERGEAPGFANAIFDKLIYSKIRKRLGLDKCGIQLSGAAPIARSTQEYFRSLGIEIYNIYGMSECTGAATFSHPKRFKLGTAGVGVPGSELKIAKDGEILMRGPHVFAGYYKDEAATHEALDADGWLHSGDIGEIDANGLLSITDRKKDLLITAGGENVAPQVIEGMLKGLGGVANAVVVGDGRKYLAALLALDAEQLRDEAAACGCSATTLREAAQSPELQAHFMRKVEEMNTRLARVQTVKKICILANDFSVEGGELTATMKVRRKIVNTKYKTEIESLYAE